MSSVSEFKMIDVDRVLAGKPRADAPAARVIQSCPASECKAAARLVTLGTVLS